MQRTNHRGGVQKLPPRPPRTSSPWLGCIQPYAAAAAGARNTVGNSPSERGGHAMIVCAEQDGHKDYTPAVAGHSDALPCDQQRPENGANSDRPLRSEHGAQPPWPACGNWASYQAASELGRHMPCLSQERTWSYPMVMTPEMVALLAQDLDPLDWPEKTPGPGSFGALPGSGPAAQMPARNAYV